MARRAPGSTSRHQNDVGSSGELFAGATRYSNERELSIFRRLFRGRVDVYPVRWESARRGSSGYIPDCANKFAPSVCDVRKTKCSNCKHQAFRPFDDEAIAKHLRGHHTIGVYPLMTDQRCWFLALDFDKKAWRKDVTAARDACSRFGLPGYVERSRSGRGAHLWLFFAEPILARRARELGNAVIAAAQGLRPSLALRSYDRMFPSQDSVPKGGFGNLIALPLQRTPRDEGNSVFLDDALEPYPSEQQWELPGGIRREQVEAVLATAAVEHQAKPDTPEPTRERYTRSLFVEHSGTSMADATGRAVGVVAAYPG